MKIYIAGHNGLVGSAILRKLKDKRYANIVCRTSKELDLRRQSDTEQYFDEERPEYVYLAAAKVGGILTKTLRKREQSLFPSFREGVITVGRTQFYRTGYSVNPGI